MLECEHAAPRRSKQVDPTEAELLPHREDLVAKDIEIPLDVVGTVRRTAAELVVHDDGALVGELLERCEVVVCRTGAAVKREQRDTLR